MKTDVYGLEEKGGYSEINQYNYYKENYKMSQEALLVKVPQAAAMLGISRTKLYELITRKEIPVCRIDRSVRISVETLQNWVRSQVSEGVEK